ncbi:MAG: hypothetical protein LAT58_14095, partial [Opitutales bacterium]|nr:hypothetical protein [Opitutales bacterium]
QQAAAGESGKGLAAVQSACRHGIGKNGFDGGDKDKRGTSALRDVSSSSLENALICLRISALLRYLTW